MRCGLAASWNLRLRQLEPGLSDGADRDLGLRNSADVRMGAVTNNQIGNAYLATDLTNMQVSFARVLNRVYKGVYTGSTMGTDTFGTRAAIHSFTVPGNTPGLPIGDDYLGWPARIS